MKKLFKILTIGLMLATFAVSLWNFSLLIKWNKNKQAFESTLNFPTRFEIANENTKISEKRDTLTIVSFATSTAGVITAIVTIFVPESKKRKRSVK